MRSLILSWWIMRGRYPLWRIIKDRVSGRPHYQVKVSGSGQYIYVLHDPFTGRPFYVGRSNNPGRRWGEHVNDRDNTKKSAYIERLLKLSAVPYMTIVEICSDDNVEERESWWIRKIGRKHNLTNMMLDPNRRRRK